MTLRAQGPQGQSETHNVKEIQNQGVLRSPGFAVGAPTRRHDGHLKVTGAATYAMDHIIQGLVHAVAVQSTVANGRIVRVDSSAAQQVQGFLDIIHHENAPRLFRPTNSLQSATKPGEIRTVFEDDRIYYAGQYVAVVVAETLEQACHAASLVRVVYEVQAPVIDTSQQAMHTLYDPVQGMYDKLSTRRGNPDVAYESAPCKHEATYFTPGEHHNPIEPSGSIAEWHGDHLTLYETTQWVLGARNTVAEILGIPAEKIRIISPFIGGAFGCKGFIWPHSVLAAIAAERTGRPVKLNLARKQMFSSCGRRAETIQEVALGATPDGKLACLKHKTLTQTSVVDEFIENCGGIVRFLYSVPNLSMSHHAVRVNIVTPTVMRAPGVAPGSFALESALDELAWKLGIDPVQLRLINHADTNEHTGQPWSSKRLKECYEIAARHFGWDLRVPRPRAMREGNLLVGWGMASAVYAGQRNPGAARVRICQDGTARVVSATQEMGGGTYTTMAQVVAEVTGISMERIEVGLGDSQMPPAPVSGGSMTTASVLPAVKEAAQAALRKLVQLAIFDDKLPFVGRSETEIVAENGYISLKDSGYSFRISYSEVLASRKQAAVEGDSFVAPGEERQKYSFQSFGAQFVEVTIDPLIARLRVSRVVSVFDVGRIINPTAARSQAYSGIIMGIGMALMENTVYDDRDGSIVNSNLADYAVPVHADVPNIEVHFVDQPDPHMDQQGLGARGIGEVTMAGVAGAIANAVYHASGIRVRDLPITPEKILAAQ